jgi:hypothetical protein
VHAPYDCKQLLRDHWSAPVSRIKGVTALCALG